MGAVLIVMGLLIALYFHAVYHYGSDPQMVNTKWGTKLMAAIPPENPMNRVLEFSGFGLAILGLIPLIMGMRKRE